MQPRHRFRTSEGKRFSTSRTVATPRKTTFDAARPTMFVSATQLKAAIPASDVAVAGTEDGFAAWLCVDGDVRASVLIGCEACRTN